MIDEARAKRYCKEDISKIENYDKAINDTNQTWHCHHRTEIWWNCSKKELIDNECYYGRKACELIFLTNAEHRSLHNRTRTGEKNPMFGKTHSEETKKKMSDTKKGEQNPMYGRTGELRGMYGKKHTAETKKKMSEARKAMWARRRAANKRDKTNEEVE